jgi:pyruvate,water dikinase
MNAYVVPLKSIGRADVPLVGGKNASLGEMLRSLGALGVSVPDGYATTVHAYRDFLRQGGLDQRIASTLKALDVDDLPALARAGAEIRRAIIDTPLPPRLQDEVVTAWRALDAGRGITVAVRSSATAEDLPDASFAGQQTTYLNVSGERDSATCSRPCAKCSRRCSTTARSLTARTMASITRASASRSAFSTWCAAISARAA